MFHFGLILQQHVKDYTPHILQFCAIRFLMKFFKVKHTFCSLQLRFVAAILG